MNYIHPDPMSHIIISQDKCVIYIPYLAYFDWDSFGPSNTLLKLRQI